jgi:glyoxylase-like metal-dependent hydrolase (beta-lactamase superfamily II)
MQTADPPNNTRNPESVPEISPMEFASSLSAGDIVQVVDVRSPQRVAAGRIDLVPDAMFHNVPGSVLAAVQGPFAIGIDPSIPVVVVCGHGNDSKIGAAMLNRMGVSARSLSGGMASWMNLTVPRVLPAPAALDHLVQFDRIGKGALGYLLVSAGEAMVIDPPRESDPYVKAAAESGARIVAVADTHVHADYISGASALARRLAIPYYLHSADNVYPYDDSPGQLDIRPLRGGMSIRIGRATVDVVHTPGHSPGSVTFRIGDGAVFTGDFLFVSSIGRPDIADRTDEWSSLLWESIQSVMNTWPRDIVIYPAHYGSENERAAGGAVCAQFGDLLSRIPPLRMARESEFKDWIKRNISVVPAAYRTIKAINVGLRSAAERESEELEAGKNECAIGGT